MEKRWMDFYDEGFPESMDYPDKTMYELFSDSVRKYPGYTACSFMGTKINYKELYDLIAIISEKLMVNGLKQREAVTICLPNIPQAVAVFYAVNRVGGIANMVHPLTPADELEEILVKTKSRYLFILDAFFPKHIGVPSRAGVVLTILCSVTDYLSPLMSLGFYITKGRKIKKTKPDKEKIFWKDFISGDIEARDYSRSISPEDPAVYLHSGGTMGSPKTIELSSYSFNVLALQGPNIVGMKDPAGLSMVTILPLFHGFGLCMGMHTMMVNGINAILVPIFSADGLASLMKKEKPNFIAAVPTLLEGIMSNKKLDGTDLSCLKAVFCGGDTLPAELKKRFDTFLKDHGSKAQVREGYGLTETVTVCSVNPIKHNRSGTVGIPLSDMLMKIVEPDTFKELAPGENGEICISGPTTMIGYLDDPEGTDKAVKVHPDGRKWVHSGDFGFMDEDGYFHFIQRIKRIIKVSGIPVFPSRVEDVIASVPGIKEVCAVAKPHPYKMHVVKVFVVPSGENVPEEELRKAILDECARKMIKHAVPAEIEFCEDLPKTKVGKIDAVTLEKKEAGL